MRTLLLGLDAASLPVLGRVVEGGKVPTLQTLISEGVSAPLQSIVPPWTPAAWPSLYTGTNPGKHGVFGFLDFEGYDWQVVNATHVREPSLWELLDHHDRSSVVVNVPVTHPPDRFDFDGALIPGYTAPEDPDCHPAGILGDVRDAVGSYRVYPPRDRGVEGFEETIRERGAAFRYLADRFEPDFGFLEFQATDTVCHEHPDDERALRAVYEAVDEQVRQTLDACDPDNVIVVSDHGIGPIDGWEFRANEHLREEGWVTATRGGDGMPTWSTVRDTQLKKGREEGTAEHGPGERAVALLARAGLTSQRIEPVLAKLGVRDVVARTVPTSLVKAGATQVDFEHSTAFVRSRIELGVRINLDGREPNGTVPEDEYEAVRDDLIASLSAVRTPDGDPVFESVDRREAHFDGPETDRAVDVVAIPREYDHLLSAELAGEAFGDPSEPWNHKRDGLMAVSGPAFEGRLGSPHLLDVAPTVLATFGLPVAARMDGDPLPVVDPPGEREYPDLDQPDRIRRDDEAVHERLRDMGYLES